MAELVSTRDPRAEVINYTQAIQQGLAPDGGLYINQGAVFPHVRANELKRLQGGAYKWLATVVKGKLIDGDIDFDSALDLNSRAYHPTAFPEREGQTLAPVTEVMDKLHIADLSRGETAAFKDFGLRSLATELGYVLEGRNESLTIAAATSGDTGSAAEAAFKPIGAVSMFMLSPKDGTMTAFQRAQMGQLTGERVHNLSVEGSFDDCQDMVKALKKDPEFAGLGAVNSINWGRIVAQTAYYFDAYLQVPGAEQRQEVDFIVPTGNFGNVLSGHIARAMGLPIRKLVVATNENNVIHKVIQTGRYESPIRPQDTSSPSMDITKASNYERLVYELFEGDPIRTRAYMQEFETTGHVSLQDHGLSPSEFSKRNIESGVSTHTDRLNSIREIRASHGMVIDPHTADGVTVALRRERDIPTICLATAAPVKFEGVIREALGEIPERKERFRDLESRVGSDGFVAISSLEALKGYIKRHS